MEKMEKENAAEWGGETDPLLLELYAANQAAMRFVEEERRRMRDFSFLRLALVIGILAVAVFGIAKILQFVIE